MPENERHPFLEGLSKHRGAPATVLVIFGASGDLTARKLVPALYNLALDNLLPADFHFIGFGRSEIATEDFRKESREAVEEFSRRPLEEELWGSLRERFHYEQGGYDEAAAFESLAKKIDELQEQGGHEVQPLFYISTPPGVFEAIIEHLGASGLARRGRGRSRAKVVIEKPFGHDLESARQLNRALLRSFDEEQVYRIDHYLGKETVQNLLVQRFANAIFEPVWNRQYIEAVQITVAEKVGVGSRAGYYDRSGALRDMLQNHTMQLLSLVAMEPPVGLDPESIRDEKVKVLKATEALKLGKEGSDVVRARYTEGLLDGEKVKGYLDEADIPRESFTETFAALRLYINNWRWAGVPFYLRSGKRLPRRVTEIAIQFRRPPGVLFTAGAQYDVLPNTMTIQVQPDEGMTLVMNSKIPGLETRTQPVKMHFRYATTFGSNTPEAYERLILDAMVGDRTLFIRGDEAEASWRLMTPVLEHWEEEQTEGLEAYAAGSWGPLAAEQLLWEKGHQWRRPGV